MFLAFLFSGLFYNGVEADSPTLIEQTLHLQGDENLSYFYEDLVIDGNIIIEDNASLLFRECNITILWSQINGKPNILISDNGELTLNNSTLWIRLDLEPRVSTSGEIELQNNAGLSLISSEIHCTDNIFMWVRDNARVDFWGSKYSGKAPQSSQHWIIEDLMPEGVVSELNDDYSIYAQDTVVISVDNSHLGLVDVSDDALCVINNSTVALLAPYSSKETQCINTELVILSASLVNKSFRHTGAISGFYDNLVLSDVLGADTGCNLRLTDSMIDLVRLNLVECISEIESAELWQLIVSCGEALIFDSDITIANLFYEDVTIRDSRITYLLGNCLDGVLWVDGCECEWVNLMGYSRLTDTDSIDACFNDSSITQCVINYMSIVDSADIVFQDVSLGNLSMKAAPRFNIILDNSRVTDTVTLTCLAGSPVINLRGNVLFFNEEPVVYHNTILCREYEVVILDEGIPVQGAQVELVKDSEVIKTGITDSMGAVFFNISWTAETDTDIIASYEAPLVEFDTNLVVRVDEVEVNVWALTDTPIVIDVFKSTFPTSVALLLVFLLVLDVAYILTRKRL